MTHRPELVGVARVTGARLLADIVSLARIGATESGGVSRPAYSEVDVAGRAHIRNLMRIAGLEPRIDAAGNSIGFRPGSDPSLAPIVLGSHTDTVPDGGRYDGALGVLAAIEVARTLTERGLALRHSVEIIDFQNEEGGLIGSRALAGRLAAADLGQRAASGLTIAEGIKLLGGTPDRLIDAARVAGSIAAYVELHIEQGRVLERAATNIGIVEGIVSIRHWEVTIDGTASHAGTTPMADRQDALLAGARLVELVHEVVTSTAGRHVGTVGRLAVFPGAPNVIASRVVLTLELRDLDASVIERLFGPIEKGSKRIGEGTGTTFTFRPTTMNPPAPTDAAVRDAIRDSAAALSLSTLVMPSGAGHDAQNMTALGPTGMLFVPSVGGISHSPRERTEDRDVVNGANVLLGTVLRLDA